MESRYSVLLIIVASIFLASCESFKVSSSELNNTHNIIIAPFKAPPIQIATDVPPIFSGLVVMAVQTVTKDNREIIAKRLNTELSNWEPSLVLAQECETIIKESRITNVNSIVIASPQELPENRELRNMEPKLFTSNVGTFDGIGHKWSKSIYRWSKERILSSHYEREYSGLNIDWIIEVSFNFLAITSEKEFGMQIAMKVFNSNTRKLIAYTAPELGTGITFDIADISNTTSFKYSFRTAAKELCGKVLHKVGLV